jgi:hypothetical protein
MHLGFQADLAAMPGEPGGAAPDVGAVFALRGNALKTQVLAKTGEKAPLVALQVGKSVVHGMTIRVCAMEVNDRVRDASRQLMQSAFVKWA